MLAYPSSWIESGHAKGHHTNDGPFFWATHIQPKQDAAVTQDHPTFYLTAEVQAKMRCSRSTVNNRIRNDPKFPKPRKAGHRLVWPAKEFDDYLERQFGVVRVVQHEHH